MYLRRTPHIARGQKDSTVYYLNKLGLNFFRIEEKANEVSILIRDEI